MRTTWWSRRAIKVHLTALVVIPACAALCVWQVDRALSGNELSWAYVFEWPIFGAYAVFMWWRLLHAETLVPDEEEAARAASDRADVVPESPPAPQPASQPASTGAGGSGGADGPTDAEADDEGPRTEGDAELEEYNRYLAALNASGRRKHW